MMKLLRDPLAVFLALTLAFPPLPAVASSILPAPVQIVIKAPDDGVTDAAPAIQAAINANKRPTGCFLLPPPAVKYKIGSTISPPAGTCIDGVAGMPTWLRLANGVNNPMFWVKSGIGNFTLRNIQLDGNKSNNNAGQGVLVSGGDSSVSSIVLQNAWVHDFHQDGFRAGNVSQVYVLGGGYYNNGYAGVSFNDGVTQFIVQSQAWNNGTHGLGCIGACAQGWFSGIAWNNGQGDPDTGAIADNFTGYNADVSDLVVGPLVSVGGGNNGVHFGGNRVNYIGVEIKSPIFHGLVHSSTKVYSTGTVSASNGSPTITGSGTAWSTLFPFGGFNAQITIGGTAYTIRKVVNDTSITLKGAGYTGTTGAGLSYGLAGHVVRSDVTIQGGHTEGGAGYYGLQLELVAGGSVVGLTDQSGVSLAGMAIVGSSNLAMTANNTSNATSVGTDFNSSVPAYATGTVTTTNGSPIVTGSGTSWLDNVAAIGSYFMISGDSVVYQVSSIDSDTQLTLSSNYVCTSCGAGKSYTLAAGINKDISLLGGTLNGNGGGGLRVRNTINSIFAGYIANNNSVYGTQEGQITTGNSYPNAWVSSGNGTAATSLSAGATIGVTTGTGNLIVRDTTPSLTGVNVKPNTAGDSVVWQNSSSINKWAGDIVGNDLVFFCPGTECARFQSTGGIKPKPVLFSALPTCAAGTEGAVQGVTDSNTATWGATIAGSGLNHVLGYCDGANWTVAGK